MSELGLLPQDKVTNTAVVLRAAAAGTVITASVVAPNLLHLLASLLNKESPDKSLRAIRHALDKGWVTFRESNKGIEVALTHTGKIRWQTVELQQPLSAKEWDHVWRFVMFDIPTRYKYNADGFRRALKRLGLQQVQQSVWATPYDCKAQIGILRQIYEIKPYVRIIETESVENEAQLKRMFNVS